ncbi:dystrotelin [Synchiropus splendidus]|uniref:dystrotelin n=1 Tax=Synchiropus splendidus TaxID=270530 RepID=UPI00237E7508|nr:dystrotelin [Synchiropus splendidus]
MDEDFRNLEDVRPSVYRTALKIQRLQRSCYMDVVLVRHITAALPESGEVHLARDEVICSLKRMFQNVPLDGGSQVTSAKTEELCTLLFKIIDRTISGAVALLHLQVVLICLSAETLQLKYRALVSVAETSGFVSRSSLRTVLEAVSLVPVVVQEAKVFGGVDEAVAACFNGVSASTISCKHMLSWLHSEPRLLLWLPTLYRLFITKNVTHNVQCHTCKAAPITGLRYRCMKCVNVQVCQNCFLTDKQSKRHKTHHPVVEFCNQPSWKESLSSLVRTSRRVLLPRRYTQRVADRRWSLMREEPQDTKMSLAPPSSDETPNVQKLCDSEDLRVETSLLAEVRNIHRDKWLLEQELQVWRLTVQSEHGVLEDRCAQMEAMMERLMEKNHCLQESLSQVYRTALTKMEMDEHQRQTGVLAETMKISHSGDSLDTEVGMERVDVQDMKDRQEEESTVMKDIDDTEESSVTTDEDDEKEDLDDAEQEAEMVVTEESLELKSLGDMGVENEGLGGSDVTHRCSDDQMSGSTDGEEPCDDNSPFVTQHFESQEAMHQELFEEQEDGSYEELLLETIDHLRKEMESHRYEGNDKHFTPDRTLTNCGVYYLQVRKKGRSLCREQSR